MLTRIDFIKDVRTSVGFLDKLLLVAVCVIAAVFARHLKRTPATAVVVWCEPRWWLRDFEARFISNIFVSAGYKKGTPGSLLTDKMRLPLLGAAMLSVAVAVPTAIVKTPKTILVTEKSCLELKDKLMQLEEPLLELVKNLAPEELTLLQQDFVNQAKAKINAVAPWIFREG